MIIQCPNCGTKYTVKEEAIKPRGRTVRCSSCGNSWHADGQDVIVQEWDERFGPDPGNLENDVMAHAEDTLCEHDAPVVQAETIPESEPKPQLEPEPAEDDEPIRRRRVEPQIIAAVAQVRSEPDDGHRSKAYAAGILVTSLIVLSSLLLLLQTRIERLWPATTRFYLATGLQSKPVGLGLALSDVHAYFNTLPTGKALTIQAVISNTTPIKQAVPSLHASLVTQAGFPQQQWTFSTGNGELAPKASTTVKATFDGAGTENGKILLTFSTENDAH